VQPGQRPYLMAEMPGEGERGAELAVAVLNHLAAHPSNPAYSMTLGLVVISMSAHADNWAGSTRLPCRWNTEPCSNPVPI
jgi:hypothetical protein